MKKVIIHAEVYTGETVIADGFVRFGKEISTVGKMSEYVPESGEEVIDASESRLVPGFIDIHSHGGYGVDNMDGRGRKSSHPRHPPRRAIHFRSI